MVSKSRDEMSSAFNDAVGGGASGWRRPPQGERELSMQHMKVKLQAGVGSFLGGTVVLRDAVVALPRAQLAGLHDGAFNFVGNPGASALLSHISDCPSGGREQLELLVQYCRASRTAAAKHVQSAKPMLSKMKCGDGTKLLRC